MPGLLAPALSVKLALLSLYGFEAETEMLKILEHFRDGNQMIGCPISHHDLKVTRMNCRFSFEVDTNRQELGLSVNDPHIIRNDKCQA
jgi:hypothetical protein